MTRDQFLSAVAKGQGRAILAVREGRYQPSIKDLRRILLRFPHEGCGEADRGWYTVELLLASAEPEQLTGHLIEQLLRAKVPSDHRSHRREVCIELAKRGVTAAKDAIYAHFSPDDDFRFANEIIELDGIAGLEWLVAHSKDYLKAENCRIFSSWIAELAKAVGHDAACAWLAKDTPDQPEIEEFILISNQEPLPKPSTIPPITFDELVRLRKQKRNGKVSPISWAASADLEQLNIAWRAFEVEEDPDWLRILGSALSRRPKYADVDKLIHRAREWHPEFNPFIHAIREIRDSRLRTFGLDLIGSRQTVNGIKLLARNAQVGDEQVLLDAAESLTDPADIHDAIVALLHTENDSASLEIREWIVEHSPCSICRSSTVRDLIKIDLAADSILQECLLDADSYTREIAKKALS